MRSGAELEEHYPVVHLQPGPLRTQRLGLVDQSLPILATLSQPLLHLLLPSPGDQQVLLTYTKGAVTGMALKRPTTVQIQEN